MHTVPEITSLAAFTRAQPSGNVALCSEAHTQTHILQRKKQKKQTANNAHLCAVLLSRISEEKTLYLRKTARVSAFPAATALCARARAS